MTLHAENARAGNVAYMEALRMNSLAEEHKVLYGDMFKTCPHPHKGNRYLSFLTGSVRPLLTFAVFGLYFYLKIASFSKTGSIAIIWTDEDEVLLGAVMGFWFGQHAFARGSNGNNGYSNIDFNGGNNRSRRGTNAKGTSKVRKSR